MKVNESKPGGKGQVPAGEIPCDFCGDFFSSLIPINDGLWAISRHCYASTEIKGEEE
jgi:hypothetical protein